MEKRLTIVQVNDTHAYFDLHPELFHEKGITTYRKAGGYARIATLLKNIREENPGQVLFVDGGDTFHGTLPAVKTKGHALVPIMNQLSPAGFTAHWEFAYTPAGFKQITEKLNFPMLAMNIYAEDTKQLVFKPYEVIEMGGLRVGLAGIASNIVGKVMPPQYSEGLSFTDGQAELPGVIDTLRNQEKVDLVVLVSHLGFPQDMRLLASVPGVDIDLSAHTHHRIHAPVLRGETLVTQAGSHGSFLTRLDILVENGKVVNFTHQLLEVGEHVEEDAETAALVREAVSPFQEELGEIVGETRITLDRGRNLETTMDNLIVDALKEYSGAEIAFSNGWRYGAPVLPGSITLNDLYNMTPMNPAVSTVKMNGSEIRQMLEENLEHTFSGDPFKQMGGYLKRVGGAKIYIKLENPPNLRIQKLFVGEEEIQPERQYQAVFITEQGVPAKYGQNRQAMPEKMIDVMRSYLHKHRLVAPTLRDTFTVI